MLRLIILFCISVLLLNHYQATAQNSVGIGTNSPNQHAVLELVSTNGDQGLLVPKLTTSQRTASTFVTLLTSNENGLLVYDSDENQFYYWQDSQWQPISNGGGDADADPQNEIQDLQLAGNTLTITNNASATPIDLSGLAGVDSQTLAASKTGSDVDVTISNGNTVVVNVDDNDADPANELQDISLTGSDLSISNGSTINMSTFLDNTDNQAASSVPVIPSGNLNSTNVQTSLEELQGDIDLDLDQDPSNEIQNVSIAGNTVGIDGGGLGFDLTPSSPSTNQVLKWDGAQWIAGSDDTGVGTLPALANAQILTNNGSNIAVSVGGDINMNNAGVMTIQPDAVSSTEIIDGSIDNTDISAGANISASKLVSTVVVQGENVSQLANDSGYLTTVSNSDIIDVDPSKISQAGAANGNVLKWNNVAGNWEAGSDLVDDADNNSTNEIQDLSLAGNTLSLTNDITPVDLSGYLDNTDAQDLSLGGNILSLTNDGSTVDLSSFLDNTDNQNAGQVVVLPSGNLTSVDVQAALVELQGDIDSDSDSDPTNEYQDLSIATDIISLSNSAGTINLLPYLDNTDNQNAAAVPVTPSGNLTSVEVQAALVELQGDIDADLDIDNTNELNLGGSLEANNILRVVDGGGNTDIDMSRLTGDLDANTNRINNLVDPAAPQDAATRAYVDNGIIANTWGITGNSGTSPGTDFVGTTDAQDLIFATNTVSRFRIYDGTGYASLGPLAAGLNPGFGVNDRFFTVSSDANGPGTSGVSSIELSGYSSNLFDEVGRLDFNTRFSGTDNLIGRVSVARTGLANAGEMRLGTHNGTSFTNHVIIDENGNVGVGAANPATKLDVTGTLRTTGFILSTTPTNGYVMTSNASGVGTWQPVPSAFSTNNRIPRGNGTTLINSDIYDDGAGHIGINAPTPTAGLHVISQDGVRFSGNVGGGSIPATGPGTRMMWYPTKAAFRAGTTTGTDWDDIGIANYSVAIGFNGIANGEAAVSLGYDNDVQAFRSVGIGAQNIVNQQQSFAGGVGNTINGQQSLTLGIGNTAGGQFSGAIGWDAVTSQDSAFALGAWVEGSNIASYVIGKGIDAANPLINNNVNSLMVGFYSNVPTFYVGPSFGFGSTGRVGIGTSTPGQKLDVNGTIRSTGFQLTSAPFANYVLTSNATGFGSWQPIPSPFSTANYIPKGDGSILVQSDIYNNAGLVGIGTVSPLTTLDVRGNQILGTGITPVAITSDDILNLQVGSSFDGATNGIAFFENTSGFGMKLGYNGVGAGADNKLAIYDNNDTEVIVFENGGNVGLGVANPSETLEVNGNIVGESLRDYTDPTANYISWDPTGELRMVGGLTNTYFYGQTDGKVRIGTQFNSGSSRLLVQGFGNGTGEGLLVRSSLGTANLVVLDNGRVGIRRTPTTYNLEIQGNAGKTTGGVDWVVISDKRLKKNVVPFSDGLNQLLEINPVKFKYNDLAPSPDKDSEYVGVLAQDIQEILPYMVQETNDIIKGQNGEEFNVLNYDNSAMTFILINAVKELSNENQILKEQLQKQDQEISKIYSLLDHINRKSNVED